MCPTIFEFNIFVVEIFADIFFRESESLCTVFCFADPTPSFHPYLVQSVKAKSPEDLALKTVALLQKADGTDKKKTKELADCLEAMKNTLYGHAGGHDSVPRTFQRLRNLLNPSLLIVACACIHPHLLHPLIHTDTLVHTHTHTLTHSLTRSLTYTHTHTHTQTRTFIHHGSGCVWM